MKTFSTVFAYLLLGLSFLAMSAEAQTITAGTYAYSRSGFAPDVTGTTTQLIGPNADNVASPVTNIGFTFWFAGTAYTQFSVSENGLMKLGGTQISGSDAVNALGSATTLPKIAPYWDDLATGTNGYVNYKVNGAAPNRVLVVTWNVTIPKNTAGAANSIFQVQLSETSGLISFTYGTPALPTNANQYSIGIGASATDFASITPTSATVATVAYGTANNANTMSPGVYTRYYLTPDATAPTITSPALASALLTPTRTVTATIGDAKTGIPTTGSFVPRIYYKKMYAGTYVSSPGVLTAGNSTSGTWSFTIDHAAVGGAMERDSIYYYIVAQDQSTTVGKPNILSSPTGVSATDVNTITVHPSAPNKYKILGAPISGTKTVGTTGADYTSLTNPGGLFEDLSDGKLVGNVTVDIITDLTSEAGTKALTAWATDAGGPYTVTIKPVGARTVTGPSVSMKFNGVNGVTIDGLNDGVNSLAFTGTSGTVMQFSMGAANNTITRTSITGGGTGVISFYDASGTFPTNCSNNTISNNIITGAATRPTAGIYFGSWVSTSGTNNVINNNIIRDFSQYGIHLDRGYSNFTISNNQIYHSVAQSSNYIYGIYTVMAVGATNIFNNKIYDLHSAFQTSLNSAMRGIFISGGGGTDVLNIYNNVVSLNANSTDPVIYVLNGIETSSPGTVNIYYNSIYIGGTGVTSGNSAGFYRGNGTVNFKNNVVFNARSCTVPGQYTKNYAVRSLDLNNFTSNNNVFYANGTSGVLGYVGPSNGMGGTDYSTIAAWKTGTTKDAASFSGDPGFSSTTDLNPDPANPNSHILNNRGLPIATIATDAAGNPRSTSIANGPTDIGASEFTPVPVFYTISGNAGIAGATLSWTDGTPQTTTADGTGAYTITVPYGWSGTVTPSLLGYTFTPANKAFDVVIANQPAQDFSAAPNSNTISGNTGVPGVTLSWTDVTLKTTTSDASGNYTITIPTGWSGTVAPSLAGYTFTPANVPYTNVVADLTGQNYTPIPVTYTISGNAGVAGATLSWTDGGAKTATADVNGNYSFTVSYNWSGTVTPSMAGYTFTPVNVAYANVLADQLNQNYTPTGVTFAISGNAGIAGVEIIWTDGTLKTATADANGDYSITVSYNWSGTVTPSLAGYTFTPANHVYANVQAAIAGQNFTPVAGSPVTISGNAGMPGVTLNYMDVTMKSVVSDANGNYSIIVPAQWSGAVSPVLAGYTFTPSSISFTSVIANQTAQNFTPAAITYTITGNVGASGATLSWTDGGAKTATADVNGNYTITVSYNWSGSVTPSLAGFAFSPVTIAYSNVLTNQINKNYSASVVTYTISGNAGIAGATLSWTDGLAKTATADVNGNYSISVSYNWSGSVTATLTGYTFSPASIAFANVLADQLNQNYTATAIIYTIAGNAGVAGATIAWTDGSAKTATADANGLYSITVSYGWSGTVTPSLTGYTFLPAGTTYTNVLANQANQNYTATAITYTITGNAGVAGATLSWTDGTAKTATADGSGNYTITVSYNWSGTVTPSMTGYTFSPANTAYANVLADQSNQNYTATAITFTITGNAGAPGVTLSWTDGTAKTTTADASGNYSITVSYNWSGTVTPSLAGNTFTPGSISYTNLLADQTGQNYTIGAITYTIAGNAGVAGVTLSWTDGTAKTTTSDVNGNYSITVSYNWSGTITPALTGYTFSPANIAYAAVLANQASQNYTATAITYTITGNAGAAGVTLSWTDGSAKTTTSDGSGNYSITVSYNWSGMVTPALTGHAFTPANIAYANLLADQANQNYTAAAITYTISGNTGAPGVTLGWTDGSAKTTTSDGSGNYSITVSYNWSGAVTPSLTGYAFAPSAIAYANVLADQTAQNYVPTPITFTISGNAGASGVTVSWTDGTAKTTTTDGSGNYSITVSYNWSGSLTPSLTGYTFAPASITLSNVLANQTAQNFAPTAITYSISGNAGLAGAVLSWTDGSAKTVTADGSGNYSITVSYNWSGTVTPSLAGFVFTPASVAYTNVLADQTGQNYVSAAVTHTISGNAGVAGVTLSWTDGIAKTTLSDANGLYTITVSDNWTGTVTPSLAGFTFAPVNIAYSNVAAAQNAQNYTATAITFSISGNAGAPGATLSWTDTTSKSTTADVNGNYSISVSYNWSGTVTPSLAGNTFAPAQRTYANILANQTAQNFTTVVNANLKVFLQGPFAAGVMTTTLNTKNLIPLSSENAYAAASFGYTARTVQAMPNAQIVDWVLVELRTGTAANTQKAVVAGFLKDDGSIVDTNGTSPLSMPVNAGSYYVVIRHRNHLAIMSAAPVEISNASPLYDFTTAQTQAYGVDAMAPLDATTFGMRAGANDGAIVISANDYNTIGLNVFTTGYLAGDHNMNGRVFVEDYNFVGSNLFTISQVP